MSAKFSEEPLKSKMDAVRAAAGVHERTFLQETPNGDLVIVTVELNYSGKACPQQVELARTAAA